MMLKQMVVGTPISNWVISARSRLELVKAAMSGSEILGTITNDLIAGDLLARLCARGKTFVDVGSHIGSVIDAASRHSKPSRVIGFEAIPEKVTALRNKFPQVAIHACALGEENKEIIFYIDEEQSGYSTLDGEIVGRANKVRSIVVPLRRLDEVINDEEVDLIKIDVEGAELGVMIGGSETITKSRSTIMFESGAGVMGGYTKERMWHWLNDRDYAVLLPTRVAHNDAGMSLSSFEEAHRYPRLSTNYFAVHRSRREELMLRARQVLGMN